MAHILKMLELPNQDSVAKMQIRRSGVESGFHLQRLSRFCRVLETLTQFLLVNDLGRALFQICELLVDCRKFQRHAMWVKSSDSRCSVRSCIFGVYSRKCGARRCASSAASSRYSS